MTRLSLLPAWLAVLFLLAGCGTGAPGTPGTATAYIDGSATFFAGTGSSH